MAAVVSMLWLAQRRLFGDFTAELRPKECARTAHELPSNRVNRFEPTFASNLLSLRLANHEFQPGPDVIHRAYFDVNQPHR